MAKIVKLDLHTHPIEALKDLMGIKGIGNINVSVAETIVQTIKAAGINGIAITERENFNHGWVASLEIFDHFQKENLIILPGAELDYGKQHYLKIYIPEYYRRRIPFFQGKEWFLILAHPGYYNPLDFGEISKVGFDAVELKSIRGEFSAAQQIAAGRNLPITRSSDAHRLEDIGQLYTELEFN
jgi:hypothetical protein